MDEPVDVTRAWKDEEYRKSLTPQQLAQLPPNPAGEEEVSEEELDEVSGGNLQFYRPQVTAFNCCPGTSGH